MINSVYACTPHPKAAAVQAACVPGVGGIRYFTLLLGFLEKEKDTCQTNKY
jgi:hypothetical protein